MIFQRLYTSLRNAAVTASVAVMGAAVGFVSQASAHTACHTVNISIQMDPLLAREGEGSERCPGWQVTAVAAAVPTPSALPPPAHAQTSTEVRVRSNMVSKLNSEKTLSLRSASSLMFENLMDVLHHATRLESDARAETE